MTGIHPLAHIEKGATIGKNVVVEPFAMIKENVVLEDNVVIKAHAYIDGFTTIKEGAVIWPYASIGTKAQDLKYKGEKTFVVIGRNCEIREYVTINSSCQENTSVTVGDHCLLMAYCHVAHNCQVGNYVIMANGAQLAGHVTVEDYAIIGGMTPVHQFCCIGGHAMVGAFSPVSHDIPPYTIGGGVPYKLGGLNLVGLKRRNFSLQVRQELSKAFRFTYRMGLGLQEALGKIEKEVSPLPEIQHWIRFCKATKRGLINLDKNIKEIEKPVTT